MPAAKGIAAQPRLADPRKPRYSPAEVKRLAGEDWEKSMITATDWPAPCEIYADVSIGGTRGGFPLGVPGYDIVYPTAPGEPKFVRTKLLEIVTDAKGKVKKYHQEFGTSPRLYAPGGAETLLPLPERVARVYIVEGEKSSIPMWKALSEGKGERSNIRVYAISGIWNWIEATPSGVRVLLPEFKVLGLRNVEVVLVPDSDYRSKGGVMKGLAGLSSALTGVARSVQVLAMPDIEGEKKVGADDYAFHYGLDALRNLLADPTKLFNLTPELVAISAMATYVELEGGVAMTGEENGRIISREDFLMFGVCRTMVSVPTGEEIAEVGKDGKVTKIPVMERTMAGKLWMTDPNHRATVRRREFEPDKPLRYALSNGEEVLNMFVGLPYAGAQGIIAPWPPTFIKVFRRLWGSAADYMLNWFRQIYVDPGHKGTVMPIIYSEIRGNGKSVTTNFIGKLFGRYFMHSDPDSIVAEFNGELRGSLLVFMDEAVFPKDAKSMGKLRDAITGNVMTIHAKNKDKVTAPSHLRFIAATNVGSALAMNSQERRFLNQQTMAPALTHEEEDAISAEMQSEEMLLRLLWNLVHSPEAVARYAGHRPMSRIDPSVFDQAAAVSRSQGPLGGMLQQMISEDNEFKPQLQARVKGCAERPSIMVSEIVDSLQQSGLSAYRNVSENAVVATLRALGRIVNMSEDHAAMIVQGKENAERALNDVAYLRSVTPELDIVNAKFIMKTNKLKGIKK